MVSQDLREDTAIQEPMMTVGQGGILHVTLPIRSTIDRKLYVDYRVRFFDANHHPLGGQGDWIPKILPPNTPDMITFNSTGPGAADFQIDLRWSE